MQMVYSKIQLSIPSLQNDGTFQTNIITIEPKLIQKKGRFNSNNYNRSYYLSIVDRNKHFKEAPSKFHHTRIFDENKSKLQKREDDITAMLQHLENIHHHPHTIIQVGESLKHVYQKKTLLHQLLYHYIFNNLLIKRKQKGYFPEYIENIIDKEFVYDSMDMISIMKYLFKPLLQDDIKHFVSIKRELILQNTIVNGHRARKVPFLNVRQIKKKRPCLLNDLEPAQQNHHTICLRHRNTTFKFTLLHDGFITCCFFNSTTSIHYLDHQTISGNHLHIRMHPPSPSLSFLSLNTWSPSQWIKIHAYMQLCKSKETMNWPHLLQKLEELCIKK